VSADTGGRVRPLFLPPFPCLFKILTRVPVSDYNFSQFSYFPFLLSSGIVLPFNKALVCIEVLLLSFIEHYVNLQNMHTLIKFKIVWVASHEALCVTSHGSTVLRLLR
jgi:hypothetical protein